MSLQSKQSGNSLLVQQFHSIYSLAHQIGKQQNYFKAWMLICVSWVQSNSIGSVFQSDTWSGHFFPLGYTFSAEGYFPVNWKNTCFWQLTWLHILPHRHASGDTFSYSYGPPSVIHIFNPKSFQRKFLWPLPFVFYFQNVEQHVQIQTCYHPCFTYAAILPVLSTHQHLKWLEGSSVTFQHRVFMRCVGYMFIGALQTSRFHQKLGFSCDTAFYFLITSITQQK